MQNSIFIAISLDGFIAGKDGGLDWLHSIPNPDHLDLGYNDFIYNIDALVMGRKTFDTVCGFDGDWPYSKPIFVLSRSLTSLPQEYRDKAELVRGPIREVLDSIHRKGYQCLYVDGGITIQSFLKEDLIDEMIITSIPILLGGGSPLFGELPGSLAFDHIKTEVLLNTVVQNHYRRKREI